ncbi:DUF374 domain-containing protein [bacterium]|nr:DUF374 domain-containing protein [bacterium]
MASAAPHFTATVRIGAIFLRHLFPPLMRAYSLFWKKDVQGTEYLDQIKGSGGVVVAWHEDLFCSIYALRGKRYFGLVSPVWQGELIGQFMKGMGFELVRGSSSTSPIAGLKSSIRILKEGKVLASILDGPEGPARIAKEGPVYLASISGKPIVPMVTHARPMWRAPSWDHHKIPLPGARYVVRYGEPMVVPSKLRKEAIASYTEQLSQRLDALLGEAKAALGEPV